MKLRLVILVVCLFCITCKTPQDASYLRSKASKQSTTDCYFNIYSGLNTIVLGISTMEDVQKLYGKGIEEEEKYHYSIDMGAGWKVLRYRYPKLGIDFESNSSSNYKSPKTVYVNKIRMYGNCNCRTPNGIKVEGDINDIRKLLPFSELLYAGTGKEKAWVKASIPVAGGEIRVKFEGTSTRGIAEFLFNEIRISYTNLT